MRLKTYTWTFTFRNNLGSPWYTIRGQRIPSVDPNSPHTYYPDKNPYPTQKTQKAQAYQFFINLFLLIFERQRTLAREGQRERERETQDQFRISLTLLRDIRHTYKYPYLGYPGSSWIKGLPQVCVNPTFRYPMSP